MATKVMVLCHVAFSLMCVGLFVLRPVRSFTNRFLLLCTQGGCILFNYGHTCLRLSPRLCPLFSILTSLSHFDTYICLFAQQLFGVKSRVSNTAFFVEAATTLAFTLSAYIMK